MARRKRPQPDAEAELRAALTKADGKPDTKSDPMVFYMPITAWTTFVYGPPIRTSTGGLHRERLVQNGKYVTETDFHVGHLYKTIRGARMFGGQYRAIHHIAILDLRTLPTVEEIAAESVFPGGATLEDQYAFHEKWMLYHSAHAERINKKIRDEPMGGPR